MWKLGVACLLASQILLAQKAAPPTARELATADSVAGPWMLRRTSENSVDSTFFSFARGGTGKLVMRLDEVGTGGHTTTWSKPVKFTWSVQQSLTIPDEIELCWRILKHETCDELTFDTVDGLPALRRGGGIYLRVNREFPVGAK